MKFELNIFEYCLEVVFNGHFVGRPNFENFNTIFGELLPIVKFTVKST